MEPRSLGPVFIPFTVRCITNIFIFSEKKHKVLLSMNVLLSNNSNVTHLMQKYIAFGNNVSLMYSYSVWVREKTLQVFT